MAFLCHPARYRRRKVHHHAATTARTALALLSLLAIACGNEAIVSGHPAAGGSTGGSGGEGGSGVGGGSMVCAPSATRACYSGPAGTEGIGICVAGVEQCRADGSGYGPCVGEVTPTEDACATPADEDCDGHTEVCPGAPLWSRQHAALNWAAAAGVAFSPQGDVVVVGDTYAPIDVGAGPVPAAPFSGPTPYLVRYAHDGTVLHHEVFVSDGHAYMRAVDTTSTGDVVFTGYFDGTQSLGGPDLISAGLHDVFLAKLSASGSDMWSLGFGDSEDQLIFQVAASGPDAIAVAGWLPGTVDFGGGAITSAQGHGLVVAKLDGSGQHIWSHQLADGEPLLWADVAMGGDGRVLVGGHFTETLEAAGTTLTATGMDGFVVALDSQGQPLFARQIAGPMFQGVRVVATDGEGNVYLGGGAQGATDFGQGPTAGIGELDAFVAKLSPAGDLLWVQRFGSPGGAANVMGLAVAPSGRVAICGSLVNTLAVGDESLTSAGKEDVFVASLAGATGEPLWSQRFGGPEQDVCRDLAVGPDGRIAVVGAMNGPITFGSETFTPTWSDGFIAVLAP